MYAKIIRIGNSQGIRIPKTILNQCDIKDTVKLQVKGKSIVITTFTKVRERWEKSFSNMSKNGDDDLLDTDFSNNTFDQEDWEW